MLYVIVLMTYIGPSPKPLGICYMASQLSGTLSNLICFPTWYSLLSILALWSILGIFLLPISSPFCLDWLLSISLFAHSIFYYATARFYHEVIALNEAIFCCWSTYWTPMLTKQSMFFYNKPQNPNTNQLPSIIRIRVQLNRKSFFLHLLLVSFSSLTLTLL